MDLRKAYNLIQIKENKKWKIVFRIKYGNFKYWIIFFGLINIFIFCQIIINNILIKYFDIFAVIYFNNIFIYFKTLKKYIQYIKIIFNKFRPSKLLLGKKKCEFHKYKINFLGFIVEKNGIKIDPKKMQKI